ncbi:MAG: peptidyl-prolyl cis-trans isomerase [bacterium]|jgi:hypothetical protein
MSLYRLSVYICACMLLMLSCGSDEETPPPGEPLSGLTISTPVPENLASRPSPALIATVTPESELLVASWDGGFISKTQLDQIMEPRVSHLCMTVPNEEVFLTALEQQTKNMVQTLVDNYLIVMDAQRRGIELSAAEKEHVLKQVKGKFNTEEEYKRSLENSGQSEEQLIKVLATLELSKKCIQEQQQKIFNETTPEVMQAYYEDHIDMFTSKARTDLNRVVVTFGENRSQEEAEVYAHALYDEVRDQVERAITFKDKRKILQNYARFYSDSWEAGYNYGYANIYHLKDSKEFSPEFLKAAEETEIGELSGVVRNHNSYLFFLVKDKQLSITYPFDDDVVQKMVPNMIMQDEMKAWIEQLRKDFNVRMYEENYAVDVEQARELYQQYAKSASPTDYLLNPYRTNPMSSQ